MLYLFQRFFGSRYGALLRAALGVVFIVVGIVIEHGAILVGLGVVFLVWAGIQAVTAQRVDRHAQVMHGGRMS